jgi:hypothetical protein
VESKQARFSPQIVAWYERASTVENRRRLDAGIADLVTWSDLVRVVACQVAGLPVEYEIDFAKIRAEMEKRPVKKAPTKRARRTTKRT